MINKLIEQLLPLIDKDNPERQNDFIVKEGLIDKLKALVNKPEQSPSASKRFKKKPAKLLDEVKELLRQLPKQESLHVLSANSSPKTLPPRVIILLPCEG